MRPCTTQALDLVEAWVDGGAHRTNIDRDDTMDSGAALAIFDRWYDKLVHGVFDDELGEEGYEAFSAFLSPTIHPPMAEGSGSTTRPT